METTEIKIPETISGIAYVIEKDWSKQGKGVSPYARPYLDAMYTLDKITDNYYCDTGASCVAYFLANAQSWKGETAKAVKKHLNTLLKGYYK